MGISRRSFDDYNKQNKASDIFLTNFVSYCNQLTTNIMSKISYDEISDWEQFENLVAAYFRSLDNEQNKNVVLEVNQSGKGSDGGRDILVKFLVNDSVRAFTRTWVVQCKFYARDLKKSDLADINIPTLIHQYDANGYLLICKQGVINTLATMFEDLNKNCKLRYDYVYWTGAEFKEKILLANLSLQKQFFPEYYSNIEKLKNRSV